MGICIKLRDDGKFVMQVYIPEKNEYGPEVPLPEGFEEQPEAAAMRDGRLPNPLVIDNKDDNA